jgi:hypothetical protein
MNEAEKDLYNKIKQNPKDFILVCYSKRINKAL